jgi:hypothetical protein
MRQNKEFVYLCPKCPVRYWVDADPNPSSRKFLFAHLAPLLVPESVYVPSLHLVATTMIRDAPNGTLPRTLFIKRMIPYVARVKNLEDESWIENLAQLYGTLMDLNETKKIGGKAKSFMTDLSKEQVAELEKEIEKSLNTKMKRLK